MIYIRPWEWIWTGDYTKEEKTFIFEEIFYYELSEISHWLCPWEDASNDALWEERCFFNDVWGIMAFAIDEIQDRDYSIVIGDTP